MCLAIPGKVISIAPSIEQPAMAKVDFGGIIKTVCTEWVDVQPGDYVLAHAGIALTVMNAAEAEQTLHDFRTIAEALAKEDETRRRIQE